MAKKKKNSAPWRTCIISSGTEKAGAFLANPANFRIHPLAQQDGLSGVLDSVGWIQQVVVNKRTSPLWEESQNVDTLVDGHLRVSLAISKGEDTEVPVLYVDLTPDEEALVLTTLDFLTGMAAIDKEKIGELMHDVHSDDERIQQLVADISLSYNVVPPNVDFKEFDESAGDDVKYIVCPKCGEQIPR